MWRTLKYTARLIKSSNAYKHTQVIQPTSVLHSEKTKRQTLRTIPSLLVDGVTGMYGECIPILSGILHETEIVWQVKRRDGVKRPLSKAAWCYRVNQNRTLLSRLIAGGFRASHTSKVPFGHVNTVKIHRTRTSAFGSGFIVLEYKSLSGRVDSRG